MAEQETIIVSSFTSGEWSELMDGRADLAKYYSACRILENFIPLPTGGAMKAPGTLFIAEVPDSASVCVLIPFLYSDTDAYVLEFSSSGIRFYRTVDGVPGIIADGGGEDPYQVTANYPYSSAATWSASDLPKLQYVQTGDVMYATHPDYKQQRLTRMNHNDWGLSAPEFVRGPFIKENTTGTTIKVNAYTIDSDVDGAGGDFVISDDGDLSDIFQVGQSFSIHGSTANDGTWTILSTAYSDPDFTITVVGGETVAASATLGTIWPDLVSGHVELQTTSPIFQSTHVGALWQITLNRDAISSNGILNAKETSEDVTTPGHVEVAYGQTVTVITKATWTGTLSLEVSRDRGATYQTVKQIASVDDNNMSEAVVEEFGDARYRLNMIAFTGAGALAFNLVAEEHEIKGVVNILSVTSGTAAVAEIKATIAQAGTVTKKWSEGAWSDYRGWPVAVTLFEQRIFFASTAYEPIAIWSSVSLAGGDYHNFQAGTDDDSALVFTLAEAQQDPIKWLSDDERLVIGTAGGEFTLGATNVNEPLTPTTVKKTKRHGIQGSASIMPVKTSLGHLFVEKGGKKVDELAFNWEKDKLVNVDMTRLAEHIGEGGITKIAFQKRPEPILWAVTGNGNLIGMVYLREEEVVGWFRRTFTGDIEDIAIIPGKADPSIAGSDEDEVWLIMHFDSINGSEKRYVCKMKPWNWGDDQEDAFLVDCGLTYEFTSPTTSITGLGHLEGEEVAVCADGGAHANKIVSNAAITLDRAASVVHVGPGYTATIKPMKIAKGTLGLGGSPKRISQIAINFYKTAYAKFGSESSDMKEIPFREAGDSMDTAVPLYSGTKVMAFPGGFEDDAAIIIESDKPLPLTIRSIAMLLETS